MISLGITLMLMLMGFIYYYFYSIASSSNSSEPENNDILRVGSTSSSSIPKKSFKYDVFISFRGEDTRKTFVDHLYEALQDKCICTYKDDEKIKRGKTIDNQLIQASKDSRFFIIVFSENYASSSWCLDELVEIMDGQKTGEQTAYPVFFHVEPTQVRKQSGPFGEAFSKNKNKDAAEKWIEALKGAAGLAGLELKNTLDGSCSHIQTGMKLIGMETRVEDVVSSLGVGIEEVRMIGIKGMGGAGKTTTARAVFDHLSNFEAKSFVKNVREVANGSVSGFIYYYFYSIASSSNSSEPENNDILRVGSSSDPSSVTPGASTSSSSSIQKKSFKYDVFISFRGEDTRKTFVDHLYEALQDKCIYTYNDDEKIKRGKTIDNQLIQAIKDSRFFIIVFSENYASSSWCLEELVQIMDCQNNGEQTAYLVFFHVEPTQVRKQSGPFGEAFSENKNKDAAGKWIEALKGAAGLAGLELKNTLDGFVKNVREVANGSVSGLKELQEQILSDVLNVKVTLPNVDDGKNMMKWRMPGKKVLLVLDDVDHIDQLEALAGEHKWFKSGSRILNTTRDEQVLKAYRLVDVICDIALLSHQEATSLFSRYAFGRENPLQEYGELSEKVIRYAAGLPLTVTVLGSFLCGQTKEDAIRILEFCGFHARNGLKVLEQRSLITISKDEVLGMHDHIEEMGKNVDKPNTFSFVLNSDTRFLDIVFGLHGTEETRCLKLNTSRENARTVMKGLGKMKKLQYLEVNFAYNDVECLDDISQYFSNSLKYLKCSDYPFLYLPKTFQANNLVGLEMKWSRMEQLWKEGEKRFLKNSNSFLSVTQT
nr:Toll/interleukin-1 receptor (TIR) domain-containing protein [Tanacetum cinerariifolium]